MKRTGRNENNTNGIRGESMSKAQGYQNSNTIAERQTY